MRTPDQIDAIPGLHTVYLETNPREAAAPQCWEQRFEFDFRDLSSAAEPTQPRTSPLAVVVPGQLKKGKTPQGELTANGERLGQARGSNCSLTGQWTRDCAGR